MSEPRSGWIAGEPRLHYLEWRRLGGAVLVLVHGNSANAWWWRPLAEQLADFPGRIIAIDLRGHGDSEWVRPPAYRPTAYAEDLSRLVEHLGLERPLIAGHSAGGLATLAYAQAFPQRARALVTIDIPVTSSARRDRYLRHLKALPVVVYPDLATAKNKFRLMPDEGEISRALLDEIAERSLTETPTGGFTMKFDRESFFGGDGLDVAAALREVRVPLLLVRAAESRILRAEAAAQAVASNGHIKLVTLPRVHHHVPLEAPHALAQALMEFINSLG
ncbi:MAG TPA: alpha/beta hydrolase [Candidatus Binataceae bacterium]|jgi:pimeloyl-ACP methyl ester carboxylesterase|nr:alpha/beta hydrolase [Candidatus Binataceae bacterium]